ncbi:MAG: hypothetical protein WKF52_05635 [Sphingomicrobium sp.]
MLKLAEDGPSASKRHAMMVGHSSMAEASDRRPAYFFQDQPPQARHCPLQINFAITRTSGVCSTIAGG